MRAMQPCPAPVDGNLSILILLLYYNRPQMVKNALLSIKNLSYPHWRLAFIDDGDPDAGHAPGRPIVERLLPDNLDQITFYEINDAAQEKARRGSRVGEFMNDAILTSNTNITIILCDDDALVSNYLSNLNRWFLANPNKNYGYSNVELYNPMVESIYNLSELDYILYQGNKHNRKKHFLNKKSKAVKPQGCLDASQVAWRTNSGVLFPSPQTKNLDASFYSGLFAEFGYCKYMGFTGQHKGFYDNNLSSRNKMYITVDTPIDPEIERERLNLGPVRNTLTSPHH